MIENLSKRYENLLHRASEGDRLITSLKVEQRILAEKYQSLTVEYDTLLKRYLTMDRENQYLKEQILEL